MILIKKCLNSSCNYFYTNSKNNFSSCDDCIYLYKCKKIGFDNRISKVAMLSMVLIVLIISAFLFGSVISRDQSTKASNLVESDYQNSDLNSTANPLENRNTVLRIHGSNTIGSKLMPKIVESFLIDKGAIEVKRIKETNSQNESIEFRMKNEDDKVYTIEIQSHGSSTAFKDLRSATCDIGMASRKINPEEIDAINKAGFGDLSFWESEITIALDGVAVIVNNQNPINNLTIEQQTDIFTGQITDWSQIGGKQGKIKVFTRDDNSGTYDTFKSLVLNGKELVKEAIKIEDSQKLSDGVCEDINAIGFVGIPFIGNSKPLAIARNGSKPIFPSTFNVSTEEYPLSRRLYLYRPSNKKNSYANELVDYILSDAGQNIVDDFDLVSLNIKVDNDYVKTINSVFQNKDIYEKYKQLISKSEGRLALNFIFKSGGYQLDNKSNQDLKRLVNFLNRSKYIDFKIVLVGYTDTIGDYNKNIELSKERALSVKSNLIALNNGLENRIDVLGMGAESPIASNNTLEGREKNRRVEVYLVSY